MSQKEKKVKVKEFVEDTRLKVSVTYDEYREKGIFEDIIQVDSSTEYLVLVNSKGGRTSILKHSPKTHSVIGFTTEPYTVDVELTPEIKEQALAAGTVFVYPVTDLGFDADILEVGKDETSVS